MRRPYIVEQNENASEFVEDIMRLKITVVEKESVSYEENTGQGLICHRFTSSSLGDEYAKRDQSLPLFF